MQFRWQSKTLWFNLFAAIMASLEATFHFLQPLFGASLYGIGAVTIALVNVVLRFWTKEPLIAKVIADGTERPE